MQNHFSKCEVGTHWVTRKRRKKRINALNFKIENSYAWAMMPHYAACTKVW